jgi:hypothetical protein
MAEAERGGWLRGKGRNVKLLAVLEQFLWASGLGHLRHTNALAERRNHSPPIASVNGSRYRGLREPRAGQHETGKKRHS